MITYSTTSFLTEADMPILAGGNAALTGNCEDFHSAPALRLEYRYYQDGSFVKDADHTRLMNYMLCGPVEHEPNSEDEQLGAASAAFFAQHWMAIVQRPNAAGWQLYGVKLYPDKVRLYFRSMSDSAYVDVLPCSGFLRFFCPIRQSVNLEYEETRFEVEFNRPQSDQEQVSVIMRSDSTPEVYEIKYNSGVLATDYPYLLTVSHQKPVYGQIARRDQITKMLQELL